MVQFAQKILAASLILLITGSALGQSYPPVGNMPYQSTRQSQMVDYSTTTRAHNGQAMSQNILWLGDLEHATALSLQTGRPILLHFEQPNCRGSQMSNQITFKHVEFIQAVYAHFIPVRINVLAKPALAKRFKITQTPTDIILDAEGKIIYRGITESNPVSYATKLATFGGISNPQQDTVNIDLGFEVDTVDFSTSQSNQQIAPATYPRTGQPQVNTPQPGYSAAPYQPAPQYQNQQLPAPNQPLVSQQSELNGQPVQRGQALPPAYPQAHTQLPQQTRPMPESQRPGPMQPMVTPAPAGHPVQTKLGLDGFCPVSLSELNDGGGNWVKGDPKYGIIHRGRLYFFAGQHQLNVFRKYPDKLAPIISGFDPVIFADQRQLVDGTRELGVSYKGRVFLFSNKRTLQQFWTAPERYAANAVAAMQRTR